MTNVITINGATIDAKMFIAETQKSHSILDQINELTLDHKELVERVALATKLSKGVVNGYLKARYKDKTKEATEKGDMYEMLDNAVTL